MSTRSELWYTSRSCSFAPVLPATTYSSVNLWLSYHVIIRYVAGPCVDVSMCSLLAVCTPVGISRMFTVMGQLIVKPKVCTVFHDMLNRGRCVALWLKSCLSKEKGIHWHMDANTMCIYMHKACSLTHSLAQITTTSLLCAWSDRGKQGAIDFGSSCTQLMSLVLFQFLRNIEVELHTVTLEEENLLRKIKSQNHHHSKYTCICRVRVLISSLMHNSRIYCSQLVSLKTIARTIGLIGWDLYMTTLSYCP